MKWLSSQHPLIRMGGAKRLLRRVSLSALIVVTGCATDKVKKASASKSGALSQFQTDKSKNLLDQLFPQVHSADEAMNLGDQSLAEGKQDLAAVYYLRAYDLDNGRVEALEKLALISEREGNARLVDAAYQTILKINPRHAGANEGLGLVRLNNRRYDEAAKFLATAVSSDAKRWKSLNGLGVIADIRGDHPTAVRYYQSALAIVPNSPMLLTNIGYSYYLQGNYAQAREHFSKALGIDPKYRRAIRNLGLLEARQKNYELAIGLLARVMDLHAAYNDAGYVSMLNGDYRKAEELFSESIRLAPTYYEKAHENMKQLRTVEQQGAAAPR